jgi:hypothetical protein
MYWKTTEKASTFTTHGTSEKRNNQISQKPKTKTPIRKTLNKLNDPLSFFLLQNLFLAFERCLIFNI